MPPPSQVYTALNDAVICLSVRLSVCAMPLWQKRYVLGMYLGYYRTIIGNTPILDVELGQRGPMTGETALTSKIRRQYSITKTDRAIATIVQE